MKVTRPSSKVFSIILISTFLFSSFALAADGRKDLLRSAYSQEFVQKKMIQTKDWTPFPRAADRKAWDKVLEHPLNQSRQKYLVGMAEKLVGEPWPALPATLYMEFARNGNRSRFQTPYFQRRENLAVLALAETMEHKGRFIDEIANGIWAICEESTWCISAHASRLKGDVLQNPDLHNLDLFACETGMTMAQVYYLLYDELKALSPGLVLRMRSEVMQRIIDPFHADEFGANFWTAGGNNWAPWCASNVMGAAMYLENDQERLSEIVYRLMGVTDRFINNYGEDGGCDEGPGYWGEAGGAMLVFLELLHSRTNGAIDIYKDPKIAEMGKFITYAQMAGFWFANFADADARTHPNPAKVYRFGERISSEAMKNMALLAMRNWDPEGAVDPPIAVSGVSRAALGMLMEIFWIPAEAEPVLQEREKQVWLPDLQVLFARESTSSYEGLALAAKGGHNAESHNHNDIGNFILFLNGNPGIIDIGRESYTRQTFSSQRYELWFTRAAGHNAPIINGVEQSPGRDFRATDVQFQPGDSSLNLSMELGKAYPPAAGIKSLKRSFDFKQGSGSYLIVTDTFDLEKPEAVVDITFYAVSPTKLITPGLLAIDCGDEKLFVEYEAGDLSVKIEPVKLTDSSLQKSWGKQLWRISFRHETRGTTGSCAFTFRAGE